MDIHLPATARRVEEHTTPEINSAIRGETAKRLHHLQGKMRGELKNRLKQLDREWDTERVLETNASLLILTGLVLGKAVNEKWYLLSGTVAAFFLQHALQGWCPPLPIIRRMGVRTAREIEAERAEIHGMLSNL